MRVVGDRVPVGVDQDRWRRKIFEEFPYDSLHGWRENEFDTFFQERGDGSDSLGHVLKEFPVVGQTTQEGS